MFTFIENYCLKITTETNKHTYLETNKSVLDYYLYKCINIIIFMYTVNLILIDKIIYINEFMIKRSAHYNYQTWTSALIDYIVRYSLDILWEESKY